MTTRGIFATLGLAAALLLAGAASARADQSARWWIVPGGQVLWPAPALDLEDNALGPGAIAGLRLDPNWALEGRFHYAKLDPASGTGTQTELWRGEGNLTYFIAPGQRFTPYFTGGAGTAGFSRGPLDGHEFAWNAGIGFLVRFNEKMALRVDGRSVSMRHPVEASDQWLESGEVFAGLSFGFGVKQDETADDDHDGVADRLDRCPNTPRGARVDADGCPLDSDGDGVWDGIDECPRTPAGVRVDARGCPKDSDGDGVWDGIDECPDTPAGAKVDKKGCTVSAKEQELIETGMIRLENVYFDTGKATIKEESHAALDEVATILNKYDDLKIEIGGHTDARGEAAFNQTLSEARAKAVRDYLVGRHNLSSTRFTTAGYGESKPVASNDTAAGMTKNRRVEFKVMNPEVLKR
ncbi:MAG TPA: OmpA family protein [Candidatus Eisenbacteria bacterium]|nr:OmpA family protein [Candidatus Eisenbacteria bacterium]